MWQPEKKTTKLYILGGVISLTMGIHYGWIVEPLFGHIHWIHAIHGRFCYIPIVIAATWFGLRGSLFTAFLISILVLPYILGSNLAVHELADEFAEIVFYLAIALLSGGLVEKEYKALRKTEDMKIQLERSQKMSLVGQIAAGMAHEIKNPLASIKGAVEILCDDSTDATERDEFKSIIFKEVKRINSSVCDFLEFARPTETKMVDLNLADVVKSSLKQIKTQAAKRNITIIGHIEDQVMVNCDEEKIHQVLLNLLLNAVDASKEFTQIKVSLKQFDNNAIVSIEDTGDGISETDLSRIFEPFFTTKLTGTGLGLAIAKNIMDKHNGTLSLNNLLDGGIVAEFTLPSLNVGVTV